MNRCQHCISDRRNRLSRLYDRRDQIHRKIEDLLDKAALIEFEIQDLTGGEK